MMSNVTVKDLVSGLEKECSLTVEAGREGLARPLTSPRLQRAGLTLAGFEQSFSPAEPQVFGRAELVYAREAAAQEIAERFFSLCRAGVPAFVVCHGEVLPQAALDVCVAEKTPVIGTPLDPSEIFEHFSNFLVDRLAEKTTLHGVLIDILGIGVLLLGKSGIGKSECAIELVMRGHRLVSDDIVEIRKKPPAILDGSVPELIRDHMEIKGLGIINVRDLFGIAATRYRKHVELVIRLVEWKKNGSYERLGLDEETYEILGVGLPYLVFPVAPGRNIASMVEIAARNQLLKKAGHYSAREFEQRLLTELSTGETDKEK